MTSTGPKAGAPPGDFTRRLAIVLTAIIMTIALGTAAMIAREQHAGVKEASAVSRTSAQAVAHHTHHVLASVFAVLEQAGERRLASTDGSEAVLWFPDPERGGFDVVEAFLLLDRPGRVFAARGAGGNAGQWTDETVRALWQASRDAFTVAAPIEHPSADGQLIPAILPVRDAGGQLRHAVVALLDPEALARSLGRFLVDENSAVLLAGRDGTIIFSTGATDAPAFRDHVLAALPRETETGRYDPVRLDDTPIGPATLHVLDEFDVVTAVAVNRAAVVFSSHQGTAILLTVASFVLIIVVLAGGAAIYRSHARLAEAKDAAERAEKEARRYAILQHAVSTLSQYAAEKPEPEALIRVVLRTVRDTFGTDGAVMLRRSRSEPDMMDVVAAVGFEPALTEKHREPAGEGTVLARAAGGHDSLLIDNIQKAGARFELAETLGARSVIVADVAMSDPAQAMAIAVIDRRESAFAPGDAYFLESVARIVSVFYERRMEERLRDAVFDNVGASMAVISSDGRILMVNETWRAVASETSESPAGSTEGANYLAVCDAAAELGVEDAARAAAGLRRVLAGSLPDFSFEYKMEVDGADQWFRAVVTPFNLDANRCAVVLHIDVTAQRLMEEQLRETQRVEAIGQLTGGVAHDFNNLLTVIIGNADLLVRRSEPNSMLAQLARPVLEAAHRGADLTNKLLSYARRQQLEPTLVDPAECLANLRSLMERTLRADIMLTTHTEPGCPPVLADASQLLTALINLVVNARDAMPDGGRIDVSAYAVPSAGRRKQRHVCFAVKDNGVGIPEELRKRVFEPFFTTKPVGEGTGLGLSMVHGFALQSGGKAEIADAPDGGTIVTISLPAVAGSWAERDDQAGHNHVAPDFGSGHRLLLVEDETQVRSFLVTLLSDVGFEVHECAEGEAAIAVLSSTDNIDILLSDIVLPGRLSGFELAHLARQQRPELRIVIMSGYSDFGTVEGTRTRPDDVPFLRKPFRNEDLLNTLLYVLEG